MQKNGFWSFWKKLGVSHIATAVLMPVFLSIITLMLYLGPSISFPYSFGAWNPLVYGVLSLFLVWPFTSFCFISFTTAWGVNPHSYGILHERYDKLQSKISHIKTKLSSDSNYLKDQGKMALEQADKQCESFKRIYFDDSINIGWLTCYSYLCAWQLLHSAEEMTIHFDPISLVIADAIHDYDVIQNSSVINRQQLLNRLNIGMSKLSQYTKSYLPPLQTDEVTQQAATPVTNDSAQEEEIARSMLHQVRRELNKFRDENWLAIIKRRNNLVQTIVLTGGVTYFLLSLSLVIGGNNPFFAPALTMATTFYCIGALAGLFGNFYGESRRERKITSVDDYNLSSARLIAVPLLSGLAAIGGVLVSTSLIALAGNPNVTFSSVFATDPQNLLTHLLTAAIFGLTPNLLIRNLQQSTDKIISNLEDIPDASSTRSTNGNT